MIKVGVIDTCVNYYHPILSDFIDLEASISFVDDSIKDYSGIIIPYPSINSILSTSSLYIASNICNTLYHVYLYP